MRNQTGDDTRRRSILLMFGALVCLSACSGRASWSLQPSGRMNDRLLVESSGVAASKKYPRILWTHNDDGLAELFAVSDKGHLVGRFVLPGANNQDWEDIALDGIGQLYIYDNTSLNDPSHCSRLYVLKEPNPYLSEEVQTIRSIRICFDDKGYDTEALFVWKDKAYLVTKPWDAAQPVIFVVDDLENGGLARRAGTVPVEAMITGADVHQEGNQIALLSYRALFVFKGDGDPAEMLQSEPLVCRLNARQVEGVTWVGDDILLTNEQREIFLVKESDWKNGKAPFLEGPSVPVPFLGETPRIDQSLVDWKVGTWLWGQSGRRRLQLARAVWNGEGLHVGVRLPRAIGLGPLDETAVEGLSGWFTAGRVYLLVNPSGERPLVYGEFDRCIVIGRSTRDGRLVTQARRLGAATVITGLEASPGWLKVEEAEGRVLVTLTPETPGFGVLSRNREIGFNVIVTTGPQELVSWTYLTQKFSFDAPSIWGLVRLER